jgi:tetratricopeptide (TPR) repeat protein
METNRYVSTNGVDPNLAVRQILLTSEDYVEIIKSAMRVEKVIKNTEEGTPDPAKVEKLNFRIRQADTVRKYAACIYELFRVLPVRNERLREAEACFCRGKFFEMDALLEEDKLFEESRQLRIAEAQAQENGQDTGELAELLMAKSCEYLLKTLLHCTYIDRPEWEEETLALFEDTLWTSKNVYVLYEYASFFAAIECDLDAESTFRETLELCRKDLSVPVNRLYEAKCLRELGCIHRKEGKFAEAIDCTRQALAIYTRFSEEDSIGYTPEVAELLTLLGDYHAFSKACPVALVEFEEALTLYRRLAAIHPEEYLSNVSEVLDKLGLLHLFNGEYNDTLPRFEEALGIRRSLVESHPVHSLSAISNTLNNYALAYLYLQQTEKARPLLEEAVRIHRTLSVLNPSEHKPLLAEKLYQLGMMYRGWKEPENAYESMKEAIDLFRGIVGDASNAHLLPLFGEALYNLDSWHWEDGAYENSIEICRETVEVYRRLAEENQKTYFPKLVEMLNRLAAMYHDTGDDSTSFPIYLEAVAGSRELVRLNSGYKHVLGQMLMGLAVYYVNSFPDREKALAAAREAKELLGPLRGQYPELEQSFNKTKQLIKAAEKMKR